MEMEQLRIEFKRLDKSVLELKETLIKVHDAIVGNELTKDGGISKRLYQAEKDLEDVKTRLENAEKKQIKYNVYVIIMWVALGGVAASIFAYILQLAFKN
jgi:hypothetical protein